MKESQMEWAEILESENSTLDAMLCAIHNKNAYFVLLHMTKLENPFLLWIGM